MNHNQPSVASNDAQTAAFVAFQQRYPGFATTQSLDALRASQYLRLDQQQQIYLDYTGGGLYAESQLRHHMELLQRGVFGNPHSKNPTSLAMTDLVEEARVDVFTYFNASPDEYEVIFTPNASGALKLVGEAYPFAQGGRYLLTFDNHNSVNGIREYARAKGATVTYLPGMVPELRVDPNRLMDELAQAKPGQPNLFAYPAQSNFSGVQHPLAWIALAQAQGWDVLVDCAAFAPTNRLDLSRWQPDFVPLSFYKIFGYPTGMGCLLARKDALRKLQRPWFAGGTITIASTQDEGWHFLIDGSAGFEDGTINYLNIPAVAISLKHIATIGIETIHERVRCLTGWLLDQLLALRHHNGAPLVRLYGPPNLEMRGSTLTFNLYDPEGRYFDYRRVEALANQSNISLRTGCFCNPGAGETAHQLTQDEMAPYFSGTAVSFETLFELEQSNGKISAHCASRQD
jgi:selenocysteine lyase/cysteine desulfurase